jgi:hypothetical protein
MLGRRCRRQFFSAAAERNDDRHRIAKDATNVRSWYESRVPVQVVELLEVGHPEIVQIFSSKRRTISPEKHEISKNNGLKVTH